jgi:hypothetical protein
MFPQGRKDRFTVTCLVVSGNHAAIGLTPDDATTAQDFPNGRVLVVVDNGNPVGGVPVDRYGYFDTTNDCNRFKFRAPGNTPENGNISVHDEP